MNSLKDRLRAIRGNKTQASFSSEIGIPLTTLGRYERGDNPPDINHIISMCNKSNISADWLLLGKGSMYPSESTLTADNAPKSPANIFQAANCAYCAKMANKMEKVEQQRDDLVQENRQWAAKAEQLLRENGDLRERCARLEERQACAHLRQ